MQRLRNYAIAFVIALLVIPLTAFSQTQENPPSKFKKTKGRAIPNRYIVVLRDDVVSDREPLEVRRAAVTAIANRHAQTYNGKPDYIYETALKGYAIELPNEAAAIAISRLPEVRWVEEDALSDFGFSSGVASPTTRRPSNSSCPGIP